MSEFNKHKSKKGKGDDTMPATTKPRTGAFMLSNEKSDQFFSKKNNGAQKAIDRFMAHKPKAGVVSPFKK